MKKSVFAFFTVIQILLFICIFVVERLSHKYMTMMRIALFKNRTWEAELPLDRLLGDCQMMLGVLAVLAILFLFIWVVKTKAFCFYGHMQLFSFALIAGGSAVFIAKSSVDAMRTYYVAVMLLLVITAIQLIKVPLFLKNHQEAKFHLPFRNQNI